MEQTRRPRPRWIGFAIGLLVVALPLTGYLVYRQLGKGPPGRVAAPGPDAKPASPETIPSPTFKIDESSLTPSGMSLVDPGPPVDGQAVRGALARTEQWLRTFTIDPFAGTGSDSLRCFAIEVDCWHWLWFAEDDAARKSLLDAAVRERLQRLLQPGKITEMLRSQGTFQGVLEILLLAIRCKDHGIDPAPLMPVIHSLEPAIRSEMDRYPPSVAAFHAWTLDRLGVDVGRPLASYRSSGLLFLQPREVEMSAGDVARLIQEVLAFTDGGTIPLSVVAGDEGRYLSRVLPHFAVSYLLLGKYELVGDLLTCMSCTGLMETYGYRDALRGLIRRQNRDGSFNTGPGVQEPRAIRLAPTASCVGALSREQRRSRAGS